MGNWNKYFCITNFLYPLLKDNHVRINKCHIHIHNIHHLSDLDNPISCSFFNNDTRSHLWTWIHFVNCDPYHTFRLLVDIDSNLLTNGYDFGGYSCIWRVSEKVNFKVIDSCVTSLPFYYNSIDMCPPHLKNHLVSSIDTKMSKLILRWYQ